MSEMENLVEIFLKKDIRIIENKCKTFMAQNDIEIPNRIQMK